MTALPEQNIIAELLKWADFGSEMLSELAQEIVDDGGYDMHMLKPQDILDALANKPEAPWWDIVFGLGENFAGYVGEFEGKQPSKREAIKLFICIAIFGLSCEHGQSHHFVNKSDFLFRLLPSLDLIPCDPRMDLMAMALRRWQDGDERDLGRKRWE